MTTSKPPTQVIPRRVIAFLLDGLIYGVISGAAFFGFASHGTSVPPSAVHFSLSLGDNVWYLVGGAGALFGLFSLVLWLALLVVLPGLTGWTIGKLIFGIRVVGADARPPGVLRSLLREIMWIVDDFPYFIPGLTGFIVALSSKGNQRVGDMVATTWVIRNGEAFSPPAPPPPPVFTQPQAPPS